MAQKIIKVSMASLAALASVLLSAGLVHAETYSVKEGDTLSKIAEEKNTSVEKLVELNKLPNADSISVGQEIEVGDEAQYQNKKLPKVRRGSGKEEAAAEQAAPATAEQAAATYGAPAAAGGYALANGNTAGAVGREAAQRMAALTGVDAGTWEAIIARESNGQVNAANASGASGLFQTMPGWGSTATVDDQINAAVRAYNAQGLSAWGY